jgi:hypothetical protein
MGIFLKMLGRGGGGDKNKKKFQICRVETLKKKKLKNLKNFFFFNEMKILTIKSCLSIITGYKYSITGLLLLLFAENLKSSFKLFKTTG